MKDNEPKSEVKQKTFEDFKKEFEGLVAQYTQSVSPQEFGWLYQAICEFGQHRIVVSPAWVSTNHGSFEMTLKYAVEKLPTPTKE